MNPLSKLLGAVRALADNLLSLADTVGQVNLAVRQRLGMDEGPTIPEEVDHTANGRLPLPAPQPAPQPPAPPRGRRKHEPAADPA